MGKGAAITLCVDGKKVGEGRVGRTHALFFSTDQTMEVGCDVGEPVSPDYGPRGNEFSGKHQMGADRYRRRRSRMPTT